MPPVLHVIYKTHLDLGFTGYADAVRQHYHEHFIPMALDTGEHFLMENPARPQFVWTTGSWLIWDHLKTQSADKVRRLENAIASGIIRWHALPFTTHTELMSPELVEEGLSISAELDARFGLKTIAAKMTDVPGHTIGLVPLLARAGVEFLHIGVNSASTPPDVPPLFRWQAPGGQEIIVAYHTDYGSTLAFDGLNDALAFAHTMDNMGPQNVGHVVDGIRAFAEAFPEHEIRASTLDAFAEALRPIRETLPVVTNEIADSWIHGVGSAPRRVSRYLAARRGYDGFAAHKNLTPQRKAFGRKLLEVAEHTWGVDIKTYLRDDTAWDKADFDTARRTDRRFGFVEGAWAEQDALVDQALALLDDADRATCALAPTELPEVTKATPIAANEPYELGPFALHFDAKTGALLRLDRDGKPLLHAAEGTEGLFGFSYETYDAASYDAYMRSYLTAFYDWGVQDHGKPGLSEAETARAARFLPYGAEIGYTATRDLVVTAALPDEASALFGAPKMIAVHYALSGDALAVTFHLRQKPACRIPEAGFVDFSVAASPQSWRMRKLGLDISPLSVQEGGNRQLHAVDAVSAETLNGGPFTLETHDTPLFSPGAQPFLPFTRNQPDMAKGGRFNLFNNRWGTNFSMWCEGDLTYRFTLRIADPAMP